MHKIQDRFWNDLLFYDLLSKSIVEALHATRNNSVVITTYSQSNIEQLGVCTVRLKHKEITARYRFFVVPGYSPALLGMSDRDLLGILKIT